MRKRRLLIFSLLLFLCLGIKENAYAMHKFDDLSSNNNLASLSASGTDLAYVEGKTEYSISYDSSSDDMKIYATLASDKASFVNGYGPRKVKLNYGKNEFVIKVKAENGNVKDYIIAVYRKDIRSDNNYLNNIVVNGKALDFDRNKLIYSFSVPNSVTNLNIRTSTSDSNASYSIQGANNLIVGDNKVFIVVKAKNKTERKYTLKVYRSSTQNVPLSSNSKLSLLEIGGYKLDFSNDKFDYKLVIKDEQQLSIKAMAEDEKATVKIIGNSRLEHNSVIQIRVVAEDGSQDVYKLNILLEGMSNMNKIAIVAIVAVVVLVLSAVVLIIGKLKKNKKQGSLMNLEVVRTQEPVVETNSEEDQQLMSFLLGGNEQKPCPHCGASNNSTETVCSSCGKPLNNGGN